MLLLPDVLFHRGPVAPQAASWSRRPTFNISKKIYSPWGGWRVEFLIDSVLQELGSQPTDIRASFLCISRLRDDIARAAYVTASAQPVVVVYVFAQKTQKTTRRDIETALRRAKEVR